jgi:SAM-dependent methyltransferase
MAAATGANLGGAWGTARIDRMTTAENFDAWYADMGRSEVRDEIVRRTLGLPPQLLSSSLLPWDGIAVVVDALGLGPDAHLLDLACGRGGYGLEIARRTGARLVGVDFSAEAISQAGQLAQRSGVSAEFRVGELVSTGLDDDSIDAALCVDAVQFAEPPVAALRECLRVLVPGGRLAVTCWEPVDADDDRVPARLRRIALARDLADAGFEQVHVVTRPDWHGAERTLWEAAVDVDASGDPALQSLQNEGARTLASFDARRRVFGTATAPG